MTRFMRWSDDHAWSIPVSVILCVVVGTGIVMTPIVWWVGWDDMGKTKPAYVETRHNPDGSTCYITYGGFQSKSISCIPATVTP